MTSSVLPEEVSQRVERFIAERRAESAREGSELSLVFDAATAATSGGKRLRARFCHTGWRAVSAPAQTEPAVLDVAAALEIFQAAALVHDDLIDNSDTRRGRPSAHRQLEQAHRDFGWASDAAAFGRSAAILLGDLLVAFSDDLFEGALASLDSPATARAEYARMRNDVTLGQFLDVAQESAWVTQDESTHADRALQIASMKSARYSVVQPLVIGAAVGGASRKQREALAAFGMPVGLAFQLRDDVLGVFGDSAVTGKPAGDDLREGKRTLLIAYTRQQLSGTPLRIFDDLLGDPTLDEAQVSMLQATIRDSGALERVEEKITEYAATADQVLRGAPLENSAVSDLRDLARAAIHRTA